MTKRKKKLNVTVIVKRRVKVDDKFIETSESATLVQKGEYTSLVQLANGDIIKRKNRDVIENEE